MTKAEMEAHRHSYDEHTRDARNALRDGNTYAALQYAVLAFPFVDGMIQYVKRYEERAIESVEVFDIVLGLAPLHFAFDPLNALEALLKSQRRIDRNTGADEPALLEASRKRMRNARILWNLLEALHTVTLEDLPDQLGGDRATWTAITSHWIEMGVLRRRATGIAESLSLATQMDEVVQAKCASCGLKTMRTKTEHLKSPPCAECKRSVSWVFLV